MTQFKPRPTIYKGIQMRSRLEAGFAAWLDERHFNWRYEPNTYAGNAGQYLPDFGLYGVNCQWCAAPATVYVETKPVGWGEREDELDEHEMLMRRMAVVWDSEPDAVLLLVQPPERNAPRRPPWVGVLDREASPARDPAYPWPIIAYWSCGAAGTTGLTTLLTASGGPWHGEWWKGR